MRDIQRSFIAGDEWLYYKIYSGGHTAEHILTEVIKPLTKKMLFKKLIDKWFFIRYKDPDKHLRIRFHLTDTKYTGEVIGIMNPYLKNLLKKDLIWKTQFDPYDREIERYGVHTITEAETLFYHDSVMISSLISMIEGVEGEEIRWLFGLKAIDRFLELFEYTDQKKLTLINWLKNSFSKEFGGSKILQKQLSNKYRKNKRKIEEFMLAETSKNQDYQPLIEILNEKDKRCLSVVNDILKKISGENLDSFLSSCIHMLMNRLFKSKNRVHEMVCYDFLYLYYKSFIVRNAKKQPINNDLLVEIQNP